MFGRSKEILTRQHQSRNRAQNHASDVSRKTAGVNPFAHSNVIRIRVQSPCHRMKELGVQEEVQLTVNIRFALGRQPSLVAYLRRMVKIRNVTNLR